MVTTERQVITDFIELYHDFPCLWNTKLESYKSLHERNMAWELLADKLKEIEPKANVATAKKKIEYLRTAYGREYRRVLKSKRSGTGLVHVPTLWYYKLLSFIKPKHRINVSHNETVQSEAISEDDDDETSKKSEELSQDQINCDGIPNGTLQCDEQELLKVVQRVLQAKSPTNAFGVYVGEQLLEMDNFQRQVAEKLISDVIFLAKSGALGFNSTVINTRSDVDTSQSPYNTSPLVDVKPHVSPVFEQPCSSATSRSSSPAQYIKLSLSPDPCSRPESPENIDILPEKRKSRSPELVQKSAVKYEHSSNSPKVIWSSPSTKIVQTSSTIKKIRLSPNSQSFQMCPVKVVKSDNGAKLVLPSSSLKKLRITTASPSTKIINSSTLVKKRLLLSPPTTGNNSYENINSSKK